LIRVYKLNTVVLILKLSGVRSLNFTVDILYNSDIEWHETFRLVLESDKTVAAALGDITMATITILDKDMSGSLILPAPPMV